MAEEREAEFDAYVGIDWGTEDYEVCWVDGHGEKRGGAVFKHSGKGIEALFEWLATSTDTKPERIAVAIEVKRGPVITGCLERGYAVFLCNPKQTDRLRDRYSLAGVKDDPLDAYILADAARKDRAQLRRIDADDPRVVHLRELVVQHNDLVERKVELVAKLRQQLHRYFPQVLSLPGHLDAHWKLELLERAPTPDKARRLQSGTLAKLLESHRIRKCSALELREVLRSPKLQVAGGVTEAATLAVSLLVPQLRLTHTQLREIDRRLDQALERFDEEAPLGQNKQRDAAILRTLPGAGRIVVATLLAEAWPALQARDYQHLRLIAGVAPVTRKSGKQGRRSNGPRPVVLMRRACNQRLRNAMFHFARCAMTKDPNWRTQAAELRARGLSVGATHRVLADRLLRVAVACVRDGEAYRPKDGTRAAAA